MSKRHESAELRVLEHLRGEHGHLKHPRFSCHWCLDVPRGPRRDVMEPDTHVALSCGHVQTIHNNVRSDPTGWQTTCHDCNRTREVVLARPMGRMDWR